MKKPTPASILCIDFGLKRIGLAGCDPLGITITALPPIHRVSFERDLAIIKGYCQRREAKGLVIGLPLDKHGSITKQAAICQKYGNKIAKALDLPLAWVNEHSSSWEAAQKYNLKDDRTGKLDSSVAALLLEQWLREGPELAKVKR